MCPSSGENTVPMRHLVLVTLYRWLSGMQGGFSHCIPDSHLYRMTNTRCRIGTVFSPDDGHIVARNMSRKVINIFRKFVHQAGSFYKIIQGWTINRTRKFHYSLTRITGTLHEDLRIFMIPRLILLRMRNVSHKCWRQNQNTHFMLNNFPPPKIMPFMR